MSYVHNLVRGLQDQLEGWRLAPSAFADVLQEVFGSQGSGAASLINDLVDSLRTGRLALRILDHSAMPAQRGAYTSEGPDGNELILLNGRWLASASPEDVEAVLLEELGHAIDHRLNGNQDTTGDEGELFASLRGHQHLRLHHRKLQRRHHPTDFEQ